MVANVGAGEDVRIGEDQFLGVDWVCFVGCFNHLHDSWLVVDGSFVDYALVVVVDARCDVGPDGSVFGELAAISFEHAVACSSVVVVGFRAQVGVLIFRGVGYGVVFVR